MDSKDNSQTPKLLLSIVTPCYNESENVLNHFARVRAALEPFAGEYDFEHIYTDNCSLDSTFEILSQLAKEHRNVKVLRFSRNIGANRAIYMGLTHATGDAAILIQADLQDPPELIPDFIRGWKEGYDVVYGQIQNREESWIMNGLRRIYYALVARLADVAPPRNAGEFRLTSRRVLDAICRYTEDDTYLRGIIAHIGYRQKAIPYARASRVAGRSSAGFLFLIGYGLNGLISTATTAPIRAVIILGISIAFLGFGVGAYAVIAKLLWPESVPRGITMLIALITFFAGTQLFAIGIIGEYIRKIYVQSLHRPLAFIQDKINFS